VDGEDEGAAGRPKPGPWREILISLAAAAVFALGLGS
jgi:hypothetical protein